jgi:hypothetical protein
MSQPPETHLGKHARRQLRQRVQTDEFSYNITRAPVHVHDRHATLLHCLGIDHTRLTFRFQGRDHRLTDVQGNVIKGLLA